MSENEENTRASLTEKIGVCQWFHYETHEEVERAIDLLDDLGVRHLRTGISWADLYREGGREWYDWQMRKLSEAGLEVLLSVWHTPPSISESGKCSSPPTNLKDYADFIDLVIDRYGDQFADLELWNEPNNRLKWNFIEEDPEWEKFAEMIRMAGHWAQVRGKRTVLGGMIPVDHNWLNLMKGYGVLDHIDIVAIHAFPGMWLHDDTKIEWDWESHWFGWTHKLAYIAEHAEALPIWVTETGLATWDLDLHRTAHHELQVEKLEEAAIAPVERLYWYCLMDLPPQRTAIEQTEGDWIDLNEYHMGLVTADGEKKPAFEAFKRLLANDGGPLPAIETEGDRLGAKPGTDGERRSARHR